MRLCPRKDLLVFALHLNASPTSNKHAHIKPCLVAPVDPILALWSGKIYADGKWMLNLFKPITILTLFFSGSGKTGKWRHIFSGGGCDSEGRQTYSLSSSSWTEWLFVLHLSWKRSLARHVRCWLTRSRSRLPPLSSQPRGWGTNEKPGEDRVAGIGRLTEPKRGREEATGEGMDRVCPAVPGDLRKVCLIGIFHLKTVWPSRIQVAKCFLGDLRFHLKKQPLSSVWRRKRHDFPNDTRRN